MNMKKVIFLCYILSIGIPHLGMGSTIEIGPGKAFTSIRKALFYAKDGDTLLVFHSLYREGNIVINKSVTLLGVEMPILDGDKKHEIISIKTDHVVFSGFKIQNSGFSSLHEPCGLKVYDGKNITIENNVFDNNFFGIYLQYASNCKIINNICTAYSLKEHQIGNGIHCWKSDSIQVIGNEIKGHRDGIYFEFVTNSIIWRNISTHNIRYGLHFMFSNHDAYISNYFASNGAGVAVMYTKNVTMYANTFESNTGDAAYGILLKEISDAEMIGNWFKNNTTGIFMDGANRILVQKNVFNENGWAIKILANCLDNQIKGNNFKKNTFDVSTNGSQVMNEFYNNYWDKYNGYDLDKNGLGDVPYHPISIYSTIIENNPVAMLLFRSFMVTLLEKTEKLIPSITPENFKDEYPNMKSFPL